MTGPPMLNDEILADAIEAAMQDSEGVSQANEEVAPNPPKEDEEGQDRRQNIQKALYGADFPPANRTEDESPEGEDEAWVSWVQGLWQSRAQSVETHLHLVARNRLFRAGHQWVSSRAQGPWANPARPKDSVRVVHNVIDKALDQRLQILTDQRPGFSITPMTADPDDKRRAQARQLASEYQYEQQAMDLKAREAAYWAQTDGCAFWHVFWDPDRGPWDEHLGKSGSPLGDLATHVVRVEQVRVSPEATGNVPPSWVVLREVISSQEAAFRYGATGVEGSASGTGHGQMTGEHSDSVASWVMSQTTIGEGQRLRNEDTVERFTVYVAPQPDVLPAGLQLVVVGNTVVFGPSDLMWAVIPVVRITDGSSDPSYYPRPVVEQWIDHQTRMNALLSKLHENIRVNSGGRFLGRPNAMSTETFLGGLTSIIEVTGGGPISDSVQPIQGFSVGRDVFDAFALEKKAFEDASGWNDVSRGQTSGESGRAIIAAREQLERVFAPSVGAMAQAFTDWCKVSLAGMAWGYDVPRALGAVGKGRPDLAKSVTGEDLDGTSDVKVEKSTLMPMPQSYRLYLLDNWLQTGVIDMREYRRRQMFAIARDISSPDEDQEARAKRIADAIRLQSPVPAMRWQDNESIHQDVLEREILLQEDMETPVVQAADARWKQLAQQAAMKMGPMLGGPSGPTQGGQGSPGTAPSVPNLPPSIMPLASGNPPMGVAPLVNATASGIPEAEQSAQTEEAMMP